MVAGVLILAVTGLVLGVAYLGGSGASPTGPSDTKPFDLVVGGSPYGVLEIVTVVPGERGTHRSFDLGFLGAVRDVALVNQTVVGIVELALKDEARQSGLYAIDPATGSVRQVCDSRFGGERLYAIDGEAGVAVVAATKGLFRLTPEGLPAEAIVPPDECDVERGVAVMGPRCLYISRSAELMSREVGAPGRRCSLGVVPQGSHIVASHRDTVIYAVAGAAHARQVAFEGEQARVIGERQVGPPQATIVGAFAQDGQLWLLEYTDVPHRVVLWNLEGTTSIKSPRVFTSAVAVPAAARRGLNRSPARRDGRPGAAAP